MTLIDYRFQRRLSYLTGGGLGAQMSSWPVVAAANWWEPTTGSFTVVAAYQPKGAADLAASYINLANPGTYDAAPGTAPSFDSDGWVFLFSAARYLTTGISAGQNWTAIARFSHGVRDGSGSYNALFGSDGAAGRRFYLWPLFTDTQCVFGGGGLRIYAQGSILSSGVMAVAGREGYINGSWVAQTDAAYNANPPKALLIGAMADASTGSPILYWTGKVQALAIYSTTLDATQIAEVTNAMNAL